MINYNAILADQQAADLAAQEQERLAAYKAAWQAYHGTMPKPLKVRPGNADDNVIVSKARVIVDTAVTYLFGFGVEWQLGETDTDTAAEEWLDTCWTVNRKQTTLLRLAMNGAVCGHVFVKIVPNAPSTAPYPRLVVLDPAMVRVTWQPDDIEVVDAYTVSWMGVTNGRPTLFRQRIERQGAQWVVIDEHARPGELVPRWIEDGRETWPHDWPPLLDCQNLPMPNEYYGEPDITPDVVQLNYARNFTLSNWQRIIKWFAHPRTWAKGVGGTTLDVGPEQTIVFNSPDASLNMLQIASDLAGTGDFDRRIDEAMHEITATPAIATGKLETVGNLSGTALQVLYGPLLSKTRKKRAVYEDFIIELCRRLLDLGGYGADNRVQVTWPELVPSDPLQEAQTMQIHAALGVVSKETMAEKLGYDWDIEEERMAVVDATDTQPEADVPEEDEGRRLLVAFQAVKEAVDAGLPLDVVLTKYLAWSDADINAMNETQAAQQPDPAEVAARVAMMQAGQQQARQGTTNEQQGTTQTPQAPGPGANSGAAHQGVGQ